MNSRGPLPDKGVPFKVRSHVLGGGSTLPVPSALFQVQWLAMNGKAIPSVGSTPVGAAVLITVNAGDLAEVSKQIIDFRRRSPWAPLILVVPNIEGFDLTEVARLAERTAARVLDTNPDRPWKLWRRRLVSTSRLAQEFGAWLCLQRPDLTQRSLALVNAMLVAGLTGTDNAGIGVGLRTVERAFRGMALQSPRRYRLFGALVKSISELAADPDLKVAEAVRTAGYEDRTSFSRAVRRELGTTPRSARNRVPWEWMAHRMELQRRPG